MVLIVMIPRSKVQGMSRKLRQGRRKYIARAKAVKGIRGRSVEWIISTDAEVTKNDDSVGERAWCQNHKGTEKVTRRVIR